MGGMGGFFSSIRAAAKKAIRMRKGRIRVVSHYDADGISSALQLLSSLRNFRNFSISIVKQMDDSVVESINRESPDLVILSDLGSSFEGTEAIEPYAIILDHHSPYDFRKSNLIHINPMFFGEERLSGSAVTYLFCREIGWEREDIASIGIVGDSRPLEGINREIVERGVERGLIRIEKTPKMFGIRTWPIHKALSMSGLFNLDESSAVQFLSEIGISPKEGDWRSYSDLTGDEKRLLIEELMLMRARLGKDTEILEDRMIIKGYSAEELSTIFNSAGRLGRTAELFEWFVGGNDKILDGLIADYRKTIASYLSLVSREKGRIIKRNGMVVLDFSDEINENFIGTITSIMSHTRDWDTVIGLGDGGENIKISMRSSSLESNRFLEKIVKDIGIAGGHKEAAGGYVPKAYKDILVERLMERPPEGNVMEEVDKTSL